MNRLVIIESPYSGDIELNLRYLRACMADCFARGDAPFASHGLYTQPGVLDDGDPAERETGINAGFAWREHARATVVYSDLGITSGMQRGILHSRRIGCAIEERKLGAPWSYSFSDGSGSYEQDLVEVEGAQSFFATSRWRK